MYSHYCSGNMFSADIWIFCHFSGFNLVAVLGKIWVGSELYYLCLNHVLLPQAAVDGLQTGHPPPLLPVVPGKVGGYIGEP